MDDIIAIIQAETPTFPLTAWEQAAVVVIFVVMLLVLAGGVFAFIRWLLRWASDREKVWQDFLKDLRIEERSARAIDQKRSEGMLDDVRDVLGTMADTMNRMVHALEDHDKQAKVILDKVDVIEQNTRPKRKPPAQAKAE